MSLQDLLAAMFVDVFPTMDSGKFSSFANALIAAGVGDMSDLCWVTEDDVKDVVLPIQVNKLLAYLKVKYGMHFTLRSVYDHELVIAF